MELESMILSEVSQDGGKGPGSAVEGGLQRLKNNECTGIIPRQKSQ
jgi:hypothetical protein